MRREAGSADANTELDSVAGLEIARNQRSHCLLEGAPAFTQRADDAKFVACQSGGEIAPVVKLSETMGQRNQHSIAGGVSMPVVDHLEIIDIDEGKVERPPFASPASKCCMALRRFGSWVSGSVRDACRAESRAWANVRSLCFKAVMS